MKVWRRRRRDSVVDRAWDKVIAVPVPAFLSWSMVGFQTLLALADQVAELYDPVHKSKEERKGLLGIFKDSLDLCTGS
jgi:hypothetical protein